MSKKCNNCSQVESIVEKFSEMMKSLTSTIENKFTSLIDKQEHEILLLKEALDKEKVKRKTISNELDNVKKEMTGLKQFAKQSAQLDDDTEQSKLINDGQISGSFEIEADPQGFVKGSCVSSFLNKVSQSKIPFTDSDILSAKVFKNSTNKNSILKIRFQNKSKKIQFLKNKSECRSKNLYISEILSSKRYNLLKECKTLCNTNNIKYIWTRDGSIFIRKSDSETDKPVLIKNSEHLLTFIQNNK